MDNVREKKKEQYSLLIKVVAGMTLTENINTVGIQSG